MRITNSREVSSPANSLFKVFRRALADGTNKQGWLAVEGPFLLEEALNAAPVVITHSVLVASGSSRKVFRPARSPTCGSRTDAGPRPAV